MIKKMATYNAIKTILSNNPNTSGLYITKQQVKDDSSCRGATMIRQGFFYTGSGTSQALADKVSRVLKEASITFKVIDHGEIWKPFKGGAPLSKQSHWWVLID